MTDKEKILQAVRDEVCPVCGAGSDDVYETETDTHQYSCECWACKSEWQVVYEVADVEIVKRGDAKNARE